MLSHVFFGEFGLPFTSSYVLLQVPHLLLFIAHVQSPDHFNPLALILLLYLTSPCCLLAIHSIPQRYSGYVT